MGLKNNVGVVPALGAVPRGQRERRRRLVALTAGLLLIPGIAAQADSQQNVDEPPAADEVPIAQGDALIPNHSFEDDLSGWTVTDGHGADPAASCTEVLSTSSEGSTDGDSALAIAADRGCRQAGALSDVAAVEAGHEYTVWADVTRTRIGWLNLHWVDEDGQIIGTEGTGRQVRGDRMELTGSAPSDAVGVHVEIGAIGALHADNVLLSAQYTALGSQVMARPQFFSSDAGVDENGRDVVWGMATGSEDDPGILIATDILTGEVTRSVRLPGATGGWAVNQNPVTGTVYVGTYGAAALWLYTPGEEEAVNAGQPDIPHWDFAYNVAFDDEGNAYGGGWGEPTDGYPGATVYTFNEDDGFTGTLGDVPLTDTAYYSRALGYEHNSRTVFVGTGTTVNLFGCGIDSGECEDITGLLDQEIQDSLEVRDMVISDGYVLAWVGDARSAGDDWLVILRPERDDAGELQVEVVDEIRGVAHPGSSPVHDGSVYYTKAGYEGWPLFEYNIETGVETQLPHDVVILARQWDIVELDDPQWPGATLVGINSGGFLTRYNIETDTIDVEQVPDIPEVSIRVNSLTTGPEGNIWSAGYLTGGIGSVSPMRDDTQESFPLGGQAEAMEVHDGRVFQGNYPGGTITSFDAAQLRDGQAPTAECTIGALQNRPYGLLSDGDRLYYGTQADSGQDVGAFGWFDSTTGECTTIEGPLGAQSVDTLTLSGERVFGGGNIFYGYTNLPVLSEASVMVFDGETEEISEVPLPVDGLRAVSASATSDDGTVWFYSEGWLLGMDPNTLDWVFTEEIFPGHRPGERIGGNYAVMLTAPDGTIYGNAGGRVFEFDPAVALRRDSARSTLEVILDGTGPFLTLDDHGNLYTRHGATGLLRIVPEGGLRN